MANARVGHVRLVPNPIGNVRGDQHHHGRALDRTAYRHRIVEIGNSHLYLRSDELWSTSHSSNRGASTDQIVDYLATDPPRCTNNRD